MTAKSDTASYRVRLKAREQHYQSMNSAGRFVYWFALVCLFLDFLANVAAEWISPEPAPQLPSRGPLERVK